MSSKLLTRSLSLGAVIASTSLAAADFGVGKANTQNWNPEAYECKRCTVVKGARGEVGVAVGYNNPGELHGANALGVERKGAVAHLNADADHLSESGLETKVQAHEIGFDNSFAKLSIGKPGRAKVELDYRLLTKYDSGKATSQLSYANGQLTPVEQPYNIELSQQRQAVGLAGEFTGRFYRVFGDINGEQKQGYKRNSLVYPRPVNFGLPVDQRHTKGQLGIDFFGRQWSAELKYYGSQFKNRIKSLSLPFLPYVHAPSPDNRAHHVSLSGQYLAGRTHLSARAKVGRMLQDDDLMPTPGNPIVNWDGRVDVIDGGLTVTSMLTSRFRLSGRFDYKDHKNKSSVFGFPHPVTDGSGGLLFNMPRDIRRQKIALDGVYRFTRGYKAQVGYKRSDIKRNFSEREKNDEQTLWGKFTARPVDKFKVELLGSYARRKGSQFLEAEQTLIDGNLAATKYHLADRNRTALELKFNFIPTDWVNLDLKLRGAKDDYPNTAIGLNEAKHFGADANISFVIQPNFTVYGLATQQRIDSLQSSSQSIGLPLWQASIKDKFHNYGAGANYTGLMENRLSVGVDYLFGESISDTEVQTDARTPYGDYNSHNHSFNVRGKYRVSESVAVGVRYRYERYFSTDAALVDVNQVAGLTTLGRLNRNYNAHQIMFSVSYLLD
ncbi:MtrB/PioB family decaheme-associated outer membrane protein [Paraferrimonas sedimenticola]|uniref:Membrane protein n=1 Tax=Paraferrimonas sedimenticola TaxID=375674 RepID=A0AA37RXN6_9GAMM|nr:MtrB/PioB family decaheme-associated outer membrane protein [Paraferrimonas sedimenticola]GLP97066.1 membrane protein [Paraferrimonas sedimenticola]